MASQELNAVVVTGVPVSATADQDDVQVIAADWVDRA
jgi:hypothetical protein